MSEACRICGQTTLAGDTYNFHALELAIADTDFATERTLCGSCLTDVLLDLDVDLEEVPIEP